VLLVAAIFYAGLVLFLYNKLTEPGTDGGGGGSASRRLPLPGLSRLANRLKRKKGNTVKGAGSGAGAGNGLLTTKAKTRPVQQRTVEDEYQLEMIQKIEQQLQIRSCRKRASDDKYSADGSCPLATNSGSVRYYNPHEKPRYLCGKRIGPKSSIEMTIPCGEPARMFRTAPDAKGTGMPPIVTRFADKEKKRPVKDFKDCDIPCQEVGTPSLLVERTIDDTPWTITFSMEGPEYYANLNIAPNAWRKNQFYSTTSYRSEIPLPYFSWVEYKIQQPAVQFDEAIKGAVFMARNCHSRNNREARVKELQKSSLRVDSVSTCLKNAVPPEGSTLKDKNSVMRKYLFYLAFENQNVEDYITEKLWGALESGVLPVYMGAPNVAEHVPPNSVINVLEYDTTDQLVAHLEKVAASKELYESYHAWRTKPLPASFHAKYDFTEVHSTCRTCRWAYSRMYGLGWNHENQTLRELVIPRKVCFNDEGRISAPFVEEWVRAADGEDGAVNPLAFPKTSSGKSSCGAGPQNRVLRIDEGSLKRTIWEQDGAIDIVIEAMLPELPDYSLRLKTGIQGTFSMSAVEDGHTRLQNAHSRFTFLTQPTRDVIVTSDGDGTIEIGVSPENVPIRLRVIVEDIDTLHQGADEAENYFGQQMIDDFYAPVEGFIL